MPGIEASTDFYRTGVGGIEYLGMVRKMAAINFYVRGLNPGNIEQGDALERFGTGILPKSKSVILANPPFGAERDKESYPNVWSEYATETETTILFVKLMLESLKDGGRCAVIVSEGFLTWDQNSARALRRALLEECDLQAIISLPQGLFVNKGGQGPKTSILYFVKGRRTQDVWFYKVTNDGYTMGTNRKVQPGCQLVEALDLFHTYIAKGKTPPESRHSFSVPADWIKVLDPRVKDRIHTDTRAEMKEKEEMNRAKLTAKLDKQLADRKITKVPHKAKLEEHAEAWYGKTENLVAQKIERAHAYSFNLLNYRSSLTADQIKAWHDFASSQIQDDDPSKNFERRYRALCEAAPADLDRLLSQLDPRHTLELDIARQFLTGLSAGDLKKYPHLRTLQEIIATQQKTPRVPLRDLLTPVSRPAKLEERRTYRRVTVKLYGKGVQLRDRVTVDDMKGDKWFVVKTGDLIFSKIDARNGAFGIVPDELDDAIVSNEFPVFTINESECHSNVLAALLTTEKFYGQIEEKASGATGRRRLEPDELLEMEVPAMPMVQQEILAKMAEKLSAVSAGAELVIDNWSISPTVFNGQELSLSDIAEIGTGSTPSRTDTKYFNGNIHWVLTAEVDECEIHDTAEKLTDKAVQDYCLRIYPPNTVLVAMYGQGKTRGKAALLQVPAAITQNCGGIVMRHPDVLPRYVYYFLRSMYEVIRGQEYSGGGVPHLNLKIIGNIRIPIPDMAEQERIVAKLDAKMAMLAELRRMRDEAQQSITQTLNRIWEC